MQCIVKKPANSSSVPLKSTETGMGQCVSDSFYECMFVRTYILCIACAVCVHNHVYILMICKVSRNKDWRIPSSPLLSPSPSLFRFNQCFGVLGILDYLHGTDDLFRSNKAFDRHTILTGLTPAKELYPDPPKERVALPVSQPAGEWTRLLVAFRLYVLLLFFFAVVLLCSNCCCYVLILCVRGMHNNDIPGIMILLSLLGMGAGRLCTRAVWVTSSLSS